MKKILAIIFSLCANYIFAQDTSSTRNNLLKSDSSLYILVEESPRFEGGDIELNKFLFKNVKYPSKARRNGTEGKVIVQFTIDKEGNTKNAIIINSVSKEIDKEALRIINLMPKWIPAKQNGRPVEFKYKLPINFTLR